jgi:hypothetical protein
MRERAQSRERTEDSPQVTAQYLEQSTSQLVAPSVRPARIAARLPKLAPCGRRLQPLRKMMERLIARPTSYAKASQSTELTKSLPREKIRLEIHLEVHL